MQPLRCCKQTSGLGETLPHKFHGKVGRRRKKRYSLKEFDEDSLNSASSSDSDHLLDDDATDPATILADRSLFSRYIDTGFGAELQNLPLRYLAPGSVTDLWKDCCANHHRVSYSSFNRCWKSFQGCLRFRSKGDFVDCDQCTALRLEIKKSRKQYSALIHASQALSLHYKNVSKSRDIEEALRSLPPTSTKPVLFLTTDGMDQSFWSLPRIQHWPGAVQSKWQVCTDRDARCKDAGPSITVCTCSSQTRFSRTMHQ